MEDSKYPDYENHKALFQTFIREHKIQMILDGEEAEEVGEDDDYDYEPNDSSTTIKKISCFTTLLQRIKDRNYYDYSSIQRRGKGSRSSVFVIEVPIDELEAWDPVRSEDMVNHALHNTSRYIDLFSSVIDELLHSMSSTGNNNMPRDSIDILHDQRLLAAQQASQRRAAEENNNGDNDGGIQNDAAANTARNNGVTQDFPPILMRRYELRILPRGRRGKFPPFDKQYHPKKGSLSLGSIEFGPVGGPLRQVRSSSIGHLVTIRGMIVRASDVKPCCVVATYSCDACGSEIYQVIQSKREFMPQRECPSAICKHNGNNRESLHLQSRGSKFVKFQELKLQELPSQVPMGHVPRSMSVYARGELTRLTSPGDEVTIDGIFLPQRVAEGGYMAMKAGLISTTFLEAQNIIVHKKSFDDPISNSLSEEERKKVDDEVLNIATGENPMRALSSAIAPEIFGHDDIKRALLLQLVGGCTRKLPDGMRIRGDINICLMGDPGMAKSQLLKHVASIAPRGVYTTGRGSSGVGLTAAVTKDATTGEMALEGGALVLADRGVCCIDEFDKMDEADRTAIHEVMEQQTVSIAKAGIIATLNARAAVLAAANPLYGRYNRKKTLTENLNLPNSLLSRFDLMFLILDVADIDRDMALARHVTFVHQNEGMESAKGETSKSKGLDEDDHLYDNVGAGPSSLESDKQENTVSPRLLREYISRARRHQPVIPPDVAPYIVEAYVELRMQDHNIGNRSRGSNRAGDQTVMTARQLLSILRLSQAIARLRFSDFVAREDVDEAIRLIHMSKASLTDEDYHLTQSGTNIDLQGGRRSGRMMEDSTSRIFQIIRDYGVSTRSGSIEMSLCEAMVIRKGFTAQQLRACIDEYQALNVIQLNNTGTHIHIL